MAMSRVSARPGVWGGEGEVSIKLQISRVHFIFYQIHSVLDFVLLSWQSHKVGSIVLLFTIFIYDNAALEKLSGLSEMVRMRSTGPPTTSTGSSTTVTIVLV